MPNPLYDAMHGEPTAPQAPATAPNAPQMTMQDAMHELQQHPAQLMKQAGFNVPDEIASNPHASVMHLIRSGQVGGPMMRRIQPLLNMLTRR